jgi:hypothetical protein
LGNRAFLNYEETAQNTRKRREELSAIRRLKECPELMEKTVKDVDTGIHGAMAFR